MPSTWAPEALKAQAVAARSYALATRAGRRAVRRLLGHAQPDVSRRRARDARDERRGRRDEAAGALLQGQGRDDVLLVDVGRQDRVEPDLDAAPRSRISCRCPIRTTTISPYHDWGPVPVTATTIAKALKLTGARSPTRRRRRTRPAASRSSASSTPFDAGQRRRRRQLRAAIGLRSTWFTVSVLSLAPPAPNAPVVYGSPVTLGGHRSAGSPA